TAPDAHVIQSTGQRVQARDDVAQALAVGQLGKGHAQQLVPARESPRATVAVVTSHASAEVVNGQMIDELSEEGASAVQAEISWTAKVAPGSRTAIRSSNRLRPSSLVSLVCLAACGKVLQA